MTVGQEGNGLRWRVDNHEERIRKLESYELAVIVREIQELKNDLKDVRSQLKWQTRTLIGAMLTMLAAIAVVLLTIPHG